MKRIVFLWILAVGVFLGVFPGTVAGADRPNVILIVCDDLNDYIESLSGHPQAQTPNIERLSRSGVCFSQAHCNIPICAPSRASFLTGLYPHTTNNFGFERWDRNEVLKNSRTLMDHFRANGYHTLGTGKLMHHLNRKEWVEYGHPADYGPYAFDGSQQVAHPDVPAPFRDIGWVDGSFGPLIKLADRPFADGKTYVWQTAYGRNKRTLRVNSTDNDPTADELNGQWAVDRLREFAKQSPDKPFFMGVGFIRPHTPLIVPERFFKQFPLDSIKLPVIRPGDVDDTHARSVRPIPGGKEPNADRWEDMGLLLFTRLVASYDSEEEALRHFIQAYLACVESVDELVGRILDVVDQSPLRDNTIVVLTSDHGWGMGEKDYLYKNSLWQESTQVPLIIRAPGIAKPGARVDHPVSLIDLYPTLIDLCALTGNTQKNDRGHRLEGFSLRPFLENPQTESWSGPDEVLTALYKWANHYDPAEQSYALRSKDWRYIRYANGKEELYDTAKDPYEWHNLAGETEQSSRLLGLRRKLKERVPQICTHADKVLFDFEETFDVSAIETKNACAALNDRRSGRALDVVLEGQGHHATVRLKSPGWNLASYQGIAMDITNRGQEGIAVLASATVGKKKTGYQSFVWVEPRRTETLFITFYRKEPPKYMDRYFENMRGLPGGFLLHWLTPDLTKLNSVTLFKARPDQEMQFTVDNIRATGAYDPPTEDELKSGFFPFVDKFGQYMHAEWPGKTTRQADINNQHRAELMDLAANPGPAGWNRYGGWAAGPQLDATGHFRTQKVDGRWWLVDPDGRLFWSQGVTGVRLSQTTKIWDREHYFTESAAKGDFRQANLKRKFGSDWNTEAAELVHTRFRSWGLNTFANWSDTDLYNMRKTPYVVALQSGIAKHVPEKLDESLFRKTVRKRITPKRVADFKDDPWCLGVFVDNELRWPKKNLPTVAETYYKVISEVLQDLAPNILYLGSRIHGSGDPRAAYTAAASYCDVVSMNRYQLGVVHEDLPAGSVDKPMIIGEFHFGALDRGLLHTGLRAVSNQRQRALAYADYVRQALENDRIVGAHWFQYSDQMVTGRGDGENYQIGFVDIVDRPYTEMISASRKLAETLYQYRMTVGR